MAHVVDGVSPFYSNESAQPAVATGIASDSDHAVFTEEPFFAQDDIAQEPLSWITACAAGAAPLGQVIWRSDDNPFKLVFVAHLRSLKGLTTAIHHALRHLPDSDLRVVLFHDKDVPAWQISRQIQDGLGLKIDRISRINGMLRLASSMVSGAGTYAHLVESTWKRRSSPSTQGHLRGVVNLLAPGAPPSGVLVHLAPEQRPLSVLTCESKDVPMYVESRGRSDEIGLVVNGPDVSKTKRIVFPTGSPAAMEALMEMHINRNGFSFVSFDTHKGNFPKSEVVVTVRMIKKLQATPAVTHAYIAVKQTWPITALP